MARVGLPVTGDGMNERGFGLLKGWALPMALAVSAVGLVALVAAEAAVPTGWRLFVLAKLLKAAWAGSVAIFAGAAAYAMLAYGTEGPGRVHVEAVRILVTFAASVSALGYFMPDWNVWTAFTAGAVVALWAIASASGRGSRAALTVS